MATVIAPPTVTRLAYAAVVDRLARHLGATRGEWRIVPLPGSTGGAEAPFAVAFFAVAAFDDQETSSTVDVSPT